MADDAPARNDLAEELAQGWEPFPEWEPEPGLTGITPPLSSNEARRVIDAALISTLPRPPVFSDSPDDNPLEFSLHLTAESQVNEARASPATRPEPVPPTARPPVRFPRRGEVLAGFRIISELGRGAFGRVYLAEQAELADRPVALKVSRAIGAEPQALARLQHAHIVPIHSVHDDPATGLRLMCMPYVGGANLAEVLDTALTRLPTKATGRSLIDALDEVGGKAAGVNEGLSHRRSASERESGVSSEGLEGWHVVSRAIGSPSLAHSFWGRYLSRISFWTSPNNTPTLLPEDYEPARRYLRSATYVQASVWIAARLAEALEHAHERGILHRDLKPSNILIASDGTPMILDFNLSADVLESGPEAGARAMLGGTLPYMAPEHLDAFNPKGSTPPEAVNERSDLYALGLILFEMVTGQHPFDDPPAGVSLSESLRVMIAERTGDPPSAREMNPQVPWSLDAILRKCLQANPAHRYARAGELAEDLRLLLDDLPLRHVREPSLRERATKWARRHPRACSSTSIGVLSIALLLMLGGFLWFVSDHLEASSARLHREDFARTFNRCQLLLNTTSGPAEHLGYGIHEADRALASYGVGIAEGWLQRPDIRRLPDPDQRTLLEELSELVQLRARAEVAQSALGGPFPLPRQRALQRAVAWLNEAERFDPKPSPALYDDRAEYLDALGRHEQATRDRNRAATLPATSARDEYLLGTSLLARHDLDGAERRLSRAVTLDPRRFWAWFALGLCQHEQGRFTEAAANFAVCTVLEPDFAWPYVNRGLALAAANRLHEALASYDRALQANPDFVEARVNRALVSLELGHPQQAVRDLDRVLALGQRDPSILAARAEALARLGQREEARRDFAEALRADPDDPALLVAEGFFLLGDDRVAAASRFRRVLSLHPSHARAHLGLAHALRQDDPREALEHVDQALHADPEFADARQLRALLRARQGDPLAESDAEQLARIPLPHRLYNAACAWRSSRRQAAMTGTPTEP